MSACYTICVTLISVGTDTLRTEWLVHELRNALLLPCCQVRQIYSKKIALIRLHFQPSQFLPLQVFLALIECSSKMACLCDCLHISRLWRFFKVKFAQWLNNRGGEGLVKVSNWLLHFIYTFCLELQTPDGCVEVEYLKEIKAIVVSEPLSSSYRADGHPNLTTPSFNLGLTRCYFSQSNVITSIFIFVRPVPILLRSDMLKKNNNNEMENRFDKVTKLCG